MLYNFYGNSTYKIGDEVHTSHCSGLDSNKDAIVIPHFPWEQERGAYQPPEQHYIPIQFDDGSKAYYPRNYLNKR